MFGKIAAKVLTVTDIASPLSAFFLPYVIMAALIGYGLLRRRGMNPVHAVKGLFPRAVFLHRSAICDYQMAVLNHVIGVFVFSGAGIASIGAASGIKDFLDGVLGPTTAHAGPGTSAIAIFALVLLVANDFGNFLNHYLQHRIPILWELHKIHHSAEVLTPVTALRVHPLSTIFASVVIALIVAPVNGLFVYRYGMPTAISYAIPLNAFLAVHYTIGVYHLQHSHIWLIFRGPLKRLLISPASHMIHHSSDPKHHDKNFAFVLTIWDWIAGTLYVPREGEQKDLVLGLPGHPELQNIFGLYATPIRKIGRLTAGWFPLGAREAFGRNGPRRSRETARSTRSPIPPAQPHPGGTPDKLFNLSTSLRLLRL